MSNNDDTYNITLDGSVFDEIVQKLKTIDDYVLSHVGKHARRGFVGSISSPFVCWYIDDNYGRLSNKIYPMIKISVSGNKKSQNLSFRLSEDNNAIVKKVEEEYDKLFV